MLKVFVVFVSLGYMAHGQPGNYRQQWQQPQGNQNPAPNQGRIFDPSMLQNAPVLTSQGQPIPVQTASGAINPAYVVAFERLVLNSLDRQDPASGTQGNGYAGRFNDVVVTNTDNFRQIPVGRIQPPGNQPPQTGTRYQPPIGTQYNSPRRGPYYQPPQTGTQYQPPQTGTQYQPPQTGTQYQPSPSSNQYQPPQSGTQHQNPQSGAFYQSHQSVSQQNPPPKNGGQYRPLLLGPANRNNRQPIRCDYKTFYVAVERMSDVACCGAKAFNTKLHDCVQNALIDKIMNQWTTWSPPPTQPPTTTTPQPLGAPYRPQVIGGPNADGRQLIKCAISSYYVPLLKVYDVMCCGVEPYNVKESKCETGVIVPSENAVTTTAKPIPSHAYRPEFTGGANSQGVVTVKCGNSKGMARLLDVPSIWCCGLVLFDDRQSRCVDRQVVPKAIQTTTTTAPALPDQIPLGAYLPTIAGPVDHNGRQLVRCQTRSFSVIAARMTDVKCCGDYMFDSSDSKCNNRQIIPALTLKMAPNLVSNLSLSFSSSEISKDELENAEDISSKELEVKTLLETGENYSPEVLNTVPGSGHVVECGTKQYIIPEDKLPTVSCCSIFAFDSSIAQCINGEVVDHVVGEEEVEEQQEPAEEEVEVEVEVEVDDDPEDYGLEQPKVSEPEVSREVSAELSAEVSAEVDGEVENVTDYDSLELPENELIEGNQLEFTDKNDALSPFASLEMIAKLNGATGSVEVGRSLPDGRRIVKCRNRKYAVIESKIAEVACCRDAMFGIFEATCVNNTVEVMEELSDNELTSQQGTYEPPPPPEFPYLGEILPDGRQVIRCESRRFAIPLEKLDVAKCCDNLAYNSVVADCIEGKVIEKTEAATRAEETNQDLDSGFEVSDDKTLPSIINSIHGRAVLECSDRRPFMVKDPNFPIFCCGESAFDPREYLCTKGALIPLRAGLEPTTTPTATPSSISEINGGQSFVVNGNALTFKPAPKKEVSISGQFPQYQKKGARARSRDSSKVEDKVSQMINSVILSTSGKLPSLTDLGIPDDNTVQWLLQQDPDIFIPPVDLSPKIDDPIGLHLIPVEESREIFDQLSRTPDSIEIPRNSRVRITQRYCPPGKFCCGGARYDKRPGQICCDGSFYESESTLLGCCGSFKYNLETHECTPSNEIMLRRH